MPLAVGDGLFRPEIGQPCKQVRIAVEPEAVVLRKALLPDGRHRVRIGRIGNEDDLDVGALVLTVRLYPGNAVLDGPVHAFLCKRGREGVGRKNITVLVLLIAPDLHTLGEPVALIPQTVIRTEGQGKIRIDILNAKARLVQHLNKSNKSEPER